MGADVTQTHLNTLMAYVPHPGFRILNKNIATVWYATNLVHVDVNEVTASHSIRDITTDILLPRQNPGYQWCCASVLYEAMCVAGEGGVV